MSDIIKTDWNQICSETPDEVVVFGVGRLTNMFARISGKRIIAVVDNDIKKSGEYLADFIGENEQAYSADLKISSYSDFIGELGASNVTVFVASYHYEDIRKQLNTDRIVNVYAIPLIDWSQVEGANAGHDYSAEKIVPNKIVIDVGMYGGHGYYITKALLGMRNDLDIVWIIRKKQDNVPSGVRCVHEGDEIRLGYELGTARIWIFDKLAPMWINKRDGQAYIQVKHWSSVTLKKFYLGEKNYILNEAKKALLEHNTQMMDYFFVGSTFDEETCREGFGFDGTFVKVGSCRSDLLFDSDAADLVRSKIGIREHVVLYAPTFRNAAINTELDGEALIYALKNKFGGEWKVLVKYHPQEAYRSMDFDSDGIINMTDYPDSEELVAIADILITDYSSIMFESAYINRPVFLYAPDREQYVGGERDLLIDFDTLPFDISVNNEQLAEQISTLNLEEYTIRIRSFLDKYGVNEDGKASKRAADFICSILDK